MKQFKNALPILWMVGIFYFSSLPGLELRGDLAVYDLVLRKLAHVFEYAVLSILWRWQGQTSVSAILISGLYAALDELHQYFVPTRAGKISDVLIDWVGVLLGIWLYRLFVQLAEKIQNHATQN